MDSELKSNGKKEYIVYLLIIISVFLMVYSLVYLINYYSKNDILLHYPNNHDNGGDKLNPNEIGDSIGGILNPIIGFTASILTFLAFYMQLKANQIQIEVFNLNQKEQNKLLKEQMFFRLVENLNQRIINFSHTETQGNKDEFISYKALDYIIKRFFYKIDYKCIDLGRQILAMFPEKIGVNQYLKILNAQAQNHRPSLEQAEEIKNSIISLKTFNERWEHIKFYVGSTDSKNEKGNEALKSIGHVQFYKIDFKNKESLYTSTYDEIYREYGGFMDGYLKNFSYLIDFIDKSNDNTFFIDYLKSNVSSQELILIFYFCASRKATQTFRNQIKKMGLLDDLYLENERFIDLPSEGELKSEIECVLKERIWG